MTNIAENDKHFGAARGSKILTTQPRKPMTVQLGRVVVRRLLTSLLWPDALWLIVTVWAAIHQRQWGWLGVGGTVLAIDGALLSTWPALKRFTENRVDDTASPAVLPDGMVNMQFLMVEAPTKAAENWMVAAGFIVLVVGMIVGSALPFTLDQLLPFAK
jgi:hypothetical protein